MKINHIGFICRGSAEWSLKHKKKQYEGYRKTFSKITELIDMQVKKNIPITTFYLLSADVEEHDDKNLMIDEISTFLDELGKKDILHANKIKISVIGKWYNLPSRIIDSIKNLIDDTKDYDGYFVNFCINYDGQEEIVDSAKMVARRVKLGKIDVDNVTKETVKDDLYSSYFMPPDYIFVAGKKRSLHGFLLWDSVDAETYFLKKDFPDIVVKEIEKMIKD